jgi:uncharacterized membrane protein
MIRARMLLPVLIGLTGLVPDPARAALTLCNRTSYRMQAALGLERGPNVSTQGWVSLDPGECKAAIETAFEADMVYVHARTPPVYGKAPLPQRTDAQFCIREQNFAFQVARGCPFSQQVPFAAARPSDGEKGPVVNLAEEADYDDAQARLAGIQRLLVIAGYDANPIDGVDGAKTQAALARFLRDHKLPSEAVAKPDFFDRLIEAANHPTGPGFSWCNDTRYTVMTALGLVDMGSIVTRGWYRIEPGRCLRPDVSGDPRRFYSYGEAVDASGRTVTHGDKPLAWGGDVTLCTREGRFELSNQKDCVAHGSNSAGFTVIDLSDQPSAVVRFKEPAS